VTREEIFAAIVAWTKAVPPPDGERDAWIDVENGVGAILSASNDAEWLSIIRDAKVGEAIVEYMERVFGVGAAALPVVLESAEAHCTSQGIRGCSRVGFMWQGIRNALAAEVTKPQQSYASAEDKEQEMMRGVCVCGHMEEDHSGSGECQVEECICGCFEEQLP
jgi:hypothetical protein